MPPIQFLTPSDVRQIGTLDYVVDFAYTIVDTLFSSVLIPLGSQHQTVGEEGMHWHNISGTSTANLMQIEHGSLELVDGNQFTENDLLQQPGQVHSVAIISEPFARKNGLTVGSVISLYRFVTYPDTSGYTGFWGDRVEDIYAQIEMTFEIVGLFDIPVDPDARSNFWGEAAEEVELSVIYVPNWTIEDIATRSREAERSVWEIADMEIPFWTWLHLQEEEVQTGVLTMLFVIEDPMEIANFKDIATEMIPPYYHFVDLSHIFEPIVSSMEMMRDMADWILYASIGATLLTLSLLMILFLYDRRHEIGVYLALGEKKGKIMSQILIEVVVTSFVAITLAIFAGNMASNMISQNMLETHLETKYADSQNVATHSFWWTEFERFGISAFSQTMTPEEMRDIFEIQFTSGTLLLFYAVGLGAVTLSTTGVLIYVARLNPKKVLM